MSEYFGQLEQQLGEAVEGQLHRRWYSRRPRVGRYRVLAVVLAALVIATPAVAAVSGWFAPGAPDRYLIAPSRLVLGKAIPRLDELLSLRFPDPDGGPPWGLRLVRYTGSEVCLQYGRVEDGQLGSLGIDYLWSDDHRFHPILPYDSGAALCAPTDADGQAFGNETRFGDQASAPAGDGGQRIPASAKCPQSHIKDAIGTHRFCPPGSGRIVFVGMLGPDARSVTYRTPTGAPHTERTAGPDGAYLIVFRADEASCKEYQVSGTSSSWPLCGVTRGTGATLRPATTITQVSYRDGRVCKLAIDSSCPPVGWVPVKTRVTDAGVASPVKVQAVYAKRWCVRRHAGVNARVVPCNGRAPAGYVHTEEGEVMRVVAGVRTVVAGPQVLLNVSFIAREPVTRAGSEYSGFVRDPKQCGGGGSSLGFSRPLYRGFHVGERLTTQILLPATCAGGVYQGVIRYTPAPGPEETEGGGAGPFGAPGSLVVGRFKVVVTRRR